MEIKILWFPHCLLQYLLILAKTQWLTEPNKATVGYLPTLDFFGKTPP